MGGTNELIAAELGVCARTLAAIRKRQPEVEAAITTGKGKADLRVVAALYKKALAGDTTACIFWLKNRQPEMWRDRHDLTHSGEVKASIAFIMPRPAAKPEEPK